MNPLQQLHALGQSVWLDYIRRDLLESGELARLVADGEVRGVTSNPTIFEQAIAGSTLYDETARPLAQAGWGTAQVFEALAIEDIRAATDLFLPLYERTQGGDGFVSIEVNPRLAYDTEGTVTEARRLWSEVNRPNVMIKIPATEPGLPAIEQSISEGINVNVTLVFSLARYNQVMQAYLRGLERRLQAGVSLDHVASVASFFVSRVDSLVDARLENILRGEGPKAPRAAALMGKAAIANAKMAYAQFKAFFDDPRFAPLRERGAQLQRPLWASTSTKNPAYRDVIYVETLIGQNTVNTLPPATLAAFREHGVAEPTIERGLSDARAQLDALQELGISMEQVTAQLETEGVGKFADSFEGLLATLESRGEQFRADLGELSQSYQEAIRKLTQDRVGARVWQRDESLWPHPPESGDHFRLEWLEYPTTTREAVQGVQPAWEAARAAGKRTLGWIGPGREAGLEQALQALWPAEHDSEVAILDSLDASSFRRFAKATPIQSSLFVVEQTQRPAAETQACLEPSWQRAAQALGEGAGTSFIALAQPDSELGRLATARGFTVVHPGAPASVGPFAALSVGGLLPAHLSGLDGRSVLAGAAHMARVAGPTVEPARNPALSLAAFLFCASNLEIEIVADEELRPLARWAADALRDGLGLDIAIRDRSRKAGAGFARIDLRSASGHNGSPPGVGVPTFVIHTPHNERSLGSVVFRWQLAMAAASALLRRNPFRPFERHWALGRLQRALRSPRRRGELAPQPARRLDGGITVWPEKRWGRLEADTSLVGVAETLLSALSDSDTLRLSLYPERARGGRAMVDRIREIVASRARKKRDSVAAMPAESSPTAAESPILQLVLESPQDDEIPGMGLSFVALNKLLAAAEFDALQAQRQVVLGIALPPGIGLQQLAEAMQAAVRNG